MIIEVAIVIAMCEATQLCTDDVVDALETRVVEEPVAVETQHHEHDTMYRGMGNGTTDVEQWRPLVAGHFSDLGQETVETALCVMRYESGGNHNAKNPTSSARGLMQILASLWAPHFGVSYNDLYKPELNLYIARQIYDSLGWGAWSAYNRGRCS